MQRWHRVPGADEEGGQVAGCTGGGEHTQCSETARSSRRAAEQDPEGSGRVSGEGEGLIPKVGVSPPPRPSHECFHVVATGGCRFYFVGDEDLLEIIGNSKNVGRLQKHFKKMFAGVAMLLLNEDSTVVTGLASKEGEEVS